MIRTNIEILIAARKRKGWTQAKLAARMRVSPGTVSHIECGRYQSDESVKLYAQKVGVDMAEVVVVVPEGTNA